MSRSTSRCAARWSAGSATTSATCACTPTRARRPRRGRSTPTRSPAARDIVFAEGRYRPGADDGRWLIAHELVHTLQQGRGGGRRGGAAGQPGGGPRRRPARARGGRRRRAASRRARPCRPDAVTLAAPAARGRIARHARAALERAPREVPDSPEAVRALADDIARLLAVRPARQVRPRQAPPRPARAGDARGGRDGQLGGRIPATRPRGCARSSPSSSRPAPPRPSPSLPSRPPPPRRPSRPPREGAEPRRRAAEPPRTEAAEPSAVTEPAEPSAATEGAEPSAAESAPPDEIPEPLAVPEGPVAEPARRGRCRPARARGGDRCGGRAAGCGARAGDSAPGAGGTDRRRGRSRGGGG